jgi:putative thioredoxin
VRGVEVDEKTWETDVIRRSEEMPVLVDFWADWCKPCKQLTPVLEQAVEGREVVLATVDVDANKTLAREYDIAGIPAVKAFKHGRVVAEFVGAKSRVAVDAFLDELTKPPVADELDDEEVAGALRASDYERAFEILIERAEDPGRRDEARRVMVELFAELGQDHPLSSQYRRRLAALLY